MSPTMKSPFCDMAEIALRWKQIVSLWASDGIHSAQFEFFMKVMDRVLFAAFTCILALGGSIMGIIAGAIKGQSTEAGFPDGAGKGAIAGAIAALGLLEFVPTDEPFSKVALLGSLLNGKLFMEWVCPAVAHAYHLHISVQEMTCRDESDMYDFMGVTGLSKKIIQKLPVHQFNSRTMLKSYDETCCSIGFLDFKDKRVSENTSKMWSFISLGMHRQMANPTRILPYVYNLYSSNSLTFYLATAKLGEKEMER